MLNMNATVAELVKLFTSLAQLKLTTASNQINTAHVGNHLLLSTVRQSTANKRVTFVTKHLAEHTTLLGTCEFILANDLSHVTRVASHLVSLVTS